jgi:hypothetical protein
MHAPRVVVTTRHSQGGLMVALTTRSALRLAGSGGRFSGSGPSSSTGSARGAVGAG